jgi:hypothetical protein
MKRLFLSFVLVWAVAGCAGNIKFKTVVDLGPVVADEIKVVSDAVETNKIGLQSIDCSTVAKKMNCYVAFSDYLGKAAEYDDAFAASIKAINTTDAKTAIANMSGLISEWIQTRLIKLPDNIRVYILVALETLRGTLLVVANNLGS